MPLYDYGNTRLRARISKLFSFPTLESFAYLTSLDSLISQLSKTHYQDAIQIALTYAHGYGCISDALRRKLIEIQDNLRRFYDPEIWEKIKTIFLREDVKILNLLSVELSIKHNLGSSSIHCRHWE